MPQRERKSDPEPEEAVFDPEPDVPPQRGVVRYVTYGVGEGDEARWGWEGVDINGQVVTRSEPTYKSAQDAERAVQER